MFEIVFNRNLSERIYYSSIVLFPWACLITSDFLYKENKKESGKTETNSRQSMTKMIIIIIRIKSYQTKVFIMDEFFDYI